MEKRIFKINVESIMENDVDKYIADLVEYMKTPVSCSTDNIILPNYDITYATEISGSKIMYKN